MRQASKPLGAVPRNQRLRVAVAESGGHLELALASEDQYPAQVANELDDGALRSRSDDDALNIGAARLRPEAKEPCTRGGCLSGEGCAMEQRATRLLADAAGLRTDTRVLMHGGVALAFRGADAASLGAGHQLRLDQHRAGVREA